MEFPNKNCIYLILSKVANDAGPNVPHLVVYVVRAQPPDHHASKGGTDGDSLEVALRVVGRPFGSRLTGVAGAAQELADVIQVGVARRAGSAEESVKTDFKNFKRLNIWTEPIEEKSSLPLVINVKIQIAILCVSSAHPAPRLL